MCISDYMYSPADQQWNQQPQSSVNAPQDNVQYRLPGHPSYDLPCELILSIPVLSCLCVLYDHCS